MRLRAGWTTRALPWLCWTSTCRLCCAPWSRTSKCTWARPRCTTARRASRASRRSRRPTARCGSSARTRTRSAWRTAARGCSWPRRRPSSSSTRARARSPRTARRESARRAKKLAPLRARGTHARPLLPSLPSLSCSPARGRAARRETQFVPPYGSGGALYVRPLLFGSGARIGLQPADEYTFVVLVTPVRARRFHTTHVMTRNAREETRESARARARESKEHGGPRARRSLRPDGLPNPSARLCNRARAPASSNLSLRDARCGDAMGKRRYTQAHTSAPPPRAPPAARVASRGTRV